MPSTSQSCHAVLPRHVAHSIYSQQHVNSSLSYTYVTSGDVRTLSTTGATPGSDRTGYLYVPDLGTTADACSNASSLYVPSNVTRQQDLPSNTSLIAIAPWLSPGCTLDYLSQSSQASVSAFVFFLPNGSSEEPPTTNDAAWGLGDGGLWKSNYDFPVYAISTTAALQILDQMSLYSGNTSSAPYGQQLTELYGPNGYVRLYMDINLGSLSGGLPSIWIFLLIILAILLIAVGAVSAIMHLLQRHRRRALRQRIASGQTDLEALGIKRMTVPQDLIDTMPLYKYRSIQGSHGQDPLSNGATAFVDLKNPMVAMQGGGGEPSTQGLYQPTCAICLDDFVESDSSVRELPCRHIFHPECIDTFLRENSSLCPMCKKSSLPKGYCPAEITNIMVRRERHLRRQRQRRENRTDTDQSRQNESMAGSSQARLGSIEMVSIETQTAIATPPPATSHGRREWARRRALAMVGSHAAVEDEGQHRAVSGPRKLLRSIFPGIG